MNITGIIVEYNPFHNGHIYHINKAKELTNPDLLIAVTSGNFSQRGEISIINKFEKTKAALEHGVDLVIELPYIYTVQSGSVFGQKSVEILNDLKVNNLVFGSETNNLEELKKFAEYNINVDHLKEEMAKGSSFPKAYGLLAGSLYPNDILGVCYLKALAKTSIKAFTIQRTNNYHDEELMEICSGKAIRKAIKEGSDYFFATPLCIDNPLFPDDTYPYLQKLLLSKDKEELKEIFLVSEGLENWLNKCASNFDNYTEFIKNATTKRYTSSRINRVCANIICNIKKQDVINLKPSKYVRVLGFNQRGQNYLKQLKENEELKIVTQFKNLPSADKQIEWKVANIYASFTKNRKDYLKQELKGPIIID